MADGGWLWISNAPFVGSGYGVQTDLFTKLMVKYGYRVMVQAFYGYRGPLIAFDGVQVLPGSLDEWGNDMIQAHLQQHKLQGAIILCDIWVYRPEILSAVNSTAWAPIDHMPLPPLVHDRLNYTRNIWAMSRYGEAEMRRAGHSPVYVPHGVDTAAYAPTDTETARKQAGWDGYDFVAMTVAANKGYPSRKSLDRLIKAWSKFILTHPNALLYIHTLPEKVHGGFDLAAMAQFYEIPPKNIKFADMYGLVNNLYTPKMLNAYYNAADVFVLPSKGEGFGVPVVEAQAAGCPVIVTDFTAQSELAPEGASYKIPVDLFDDLEYSLQGAEWANVRPSEIVTALEWAYENRKNADMRKTAREFALDYDAEHVFKKYMEPALKLQMEQVGEVTDARQKRKQERLALRQEKEKVSA